MLREEEESGGRVTDGHAGQLSFREGSSLACPEARTCCTNPCRSLTPALADNYDVPTPWANLCPLLLRLNTSMCPCAPHRAFSLGSGISILRSRRPGRSSAGSSTSGRLVAMIILTWGSK